MASMLPSPYVPLARLARHQPLGTHNSEAPASWLGLFFLPFNITFLLLGPTTCLLKVYCLRNNVRNWEDSTCNRFKWCTKSIRFQNETD